MRVFLSHTKLCLAMSHEKSSPFAVLRFALLLALIQLASPVILFVPLLLWRVLGGNSPVPLSTDVLVWVGSHFHK